MSKQVSAEIKELLGFITTEIGAGMVLFPKSPAEHAHNNSCERAKSIISNYAEGCGLFQMTRQPQRAHATAPTTEKAEDSAKA